MVICDIWSAIGTIVYFAWQLAPAILIWRLRTKDGLSRLGAVLAAMIAIIGTVGAYYIALTSSSSTAPLLLLFSPLYLMGAVLLVFGGDFTIRHSFRRRR